MDALLSHIRDQLGKTNAEHLALIQSLTADASIEEFVRGLDIYIAASIVPLVKSLSRGMSREEFDIVVPKMAALYSERVIQMGAIINEARGSVFDDPEGRN